MTQYSIYNQTLHILNPEAEEWSADAFDAVEKHAAVQALHLSFISSLSTAEKTAFIADSTLNLPDSFFEAATAELSKQLNESEAETLLGIRVLGHNTSLLLAAGGDDRLTLQLDHSTGKVNKYLGSTFVRPGITLRGSCTCSTLTSKGLSVAKATHRQMFSDVLAGVPVSQVLMEETDDIRRRLHSALHTSPASTSIVLFPSGSDAELIPSLIALVRSSVLRSRQQDTDSVNDTTPKVYSFVTGAGEVGSGTAKASGGRHFSDTPNAPSDVTVADGKSLEGLLTGDIEVIEFKARSADGSVCLQEDTLCHTLRDKLTGPGSSSSSVAVLHTVIGTKTGLVYPGLELVRALQAEFGERLVVVVDACQLRCRLEMMQEYVDLGAFVLITGSKFFCGPPFSGAVLCPAHLARELEENVSNSSSVVPVGLQSYLTPYEVPKEMPRLRSFLTVSDKQQSPRAAWMNPGLVLRWTCALDTMSALSTLPPKEVAVFTKQWVRGVQAMLSECGPYLQCLEERGEDGGSNSEVMPGDICSIVSFVAYAPPASEGASSKCLCFDDMKRLWVQMAEGDSKAAMGQPVLLSPEVTVLRVALGAQMVVEALSPETQSERDEVQARMRSEDESIVRKLKELVELRWTSKE